MEYSEASLSRDEHNVAPRALQIVVAYAGVHGRLLFSLYCWFPLTQKIGCIMTSFAVQLHGKQ